MKRSAAFLAALLMEFVPLNPPVPASSGNHPATAQSSPSDSHISGQKGTRTYLIRVIDTQSKAPVSKVKITVLLDDSAKTKWTGYTDSKGVFQFKWHAIAQSVKAHISIQAKGFMTLDDYNLLIEDRVIPLNRAD
jgi:hypothetical protein